jgi:hypothetical protein
MIEVMNDAGRDFEAGDPEDEAAINAIARRLGDAVDSEQMRLILPALGKLAVFICLNGGAGDDAKPVEPDCVFRTFVNELACHFGRALARMVKEAEEEIESWPPNDPDYAGERMAAHKEWDRVTQAEAEMKEWWPPK